MTSFKEFEGKNIETATQRACKELGLRKEELQIETVSRGSTGIFGIVGAKKARIRVALPESRTAGEDRKDEAGPAPSPPVDSADRDAAVPSAGDLGKTVIENILEAISPDSIVAVEMKNERIHYGITGGDPAILIGKRGQTLDAIQYITEKIINKQSENRVRIQVDVEGYLEDRKASLKELAGRLSEKVKRTGKPVTVGHMTAHDRRIIHLTLKNDNKVRTQSLGEGFLRKLVIFPKRQQGRKKPGKSAKDD